MIDKETCIIQKECWMPKAFDSLKESMTKVPLLTIPDPKKSTLYMYILYKDTSSKTTGECLTQPSSENEI